MKYIWVVLVVGAILIVAIFFKCRKTTYIEGKLSNVRYFDRPLTEQEIYQLYNEEKCTKEK